MITASFPNPELQARFIADVNSLIFQDYQVELDWDCTKFQSVKGASESFIKQHLLVMGWKNVSNHSTFRNALKDAGFKVSYGKNARGKKGHVIHV